MGTGMKDGGDCYIVTCMFVGLFAVFQEPHGQLPGGCRGEEGWTVIVHGVVNLDIWGPLLCRVNSIPNILAVVSN